MYFLKKSNVPRKKEAIPLDLLRVMIKRKVFRNYFFYKVSQKAKHSMIK